MGIFPHTSKTLLSSCFLKSNACKTCKDSMNVNYNNIYIERLIKLIFTHTEFDNKNKVN